MDTLVVGLLCGLGFGLAALWWHLMVHPDVVLSLWSDRALNEPEAPPDPHTLTWLRRALGGLVVLSGFLAGAALAFLASTGG